MKPKIPFNNDTQEPESNELFRFMLESIKDYAVFATDTNGTIISWNVGAQRIFGYATEEILGKTFSILFTPEDVAAAVPQKELAKAAANGRAEDERWHLRLDKSRFWASGVVNPLKDEQGALRGFVKVARDETEFRRLQELEQTARLEAGRDYQQQLEALANSIPQMAWMAEPDGYIFWYNRRWYEYTGTTLEDMQGWGWQSVHDPDILPQVLERWGKTIAHGEPFDMEFPLKGADGKFRWFLTRVQPMRNNEGRVVKWFGTNTDIDELRRATEALKASEAELRGVVHSEMVGILFFSKEGVIEDANDLFLRMIGYTRDDLFAQKLSWVDLTPPGWEEADQKAVDELAQRGACAPFEKEYLRKDGTRLPVLIGGTILDEKSGRGVAFVIDNTERKQVEAEREKLHQLESEARAESETINATGRLLAAELDLQKVVQAVTDAATQLTGARFGAFFYNLINEQGESYTLYTLSGVPRESFEGFPMPRATALFGPTFRGEASVLIEDVFKDERYGKNEPYHGMPAGHLPVRSYLAVSVISRTGEVIGGLFFGHPEPGMFSKRDVRIVEGLAAQAAIAVDNARLFEAVQKERIKAVETARENERLYREAQEANRLKDEFLATISHELRTPLTSILGWSRMLATETFDETTRKRGLETIERNARSQGQIIEDLLDISRIITGKLRLNLQLVEPYSIIEAAIDSVRPTVEAKNLRLQTILDPHAGPISGDPDRLQQIFWNLLSNAVKFTPKGGRVQVRLERINSHVEVSISDTGAGIPADFLPHVFERFRQGDGTTTRKHGGLGLGLSIVKQLVDLHGGVIRAASEGEERGANFTVSLPIAVVQTTTINEDQLARVHPGNNGSVSFECPPQLAGLRVLIVDDEEDARELLTMVMNKCEALVRVVSSAKEAITELENFRPDVLISDIGMPEEDGYELIRRVRSLPKERGGRTPAIALTAYARVEDRMKALSYGYQMHVPKPVEPAELVTVIASLVHWRN